MAKVTLRTLQQIEEMSLEGQLIVRGYYKSIFDRVADPKDWKGPIRAVLHPDAVDADFDTIYHAVVYFTGNADCSVRLDNTGLFPNIVVTSRGYRAGPAGT